MELQRRLRELLDGAEVRELAGGHQSRVFETTGPGDRRIVKVVDASLVDRDVHATRIETVAALAGTDPHVCRPLPVRGRLLTDVDLGRDRRGLVTCTEHAGDDTVDPASPRDACRMGETLAELHRSLRRLGPTDLAPVAALRVAPAHVAGPQQLLHGDFSASNLRKQDGTLRVFDFDECGYGPAAFDVANALYMVRFDDMTRDDAAPSRPFEEAFLAGYAEVSGHAPDMDELAGLIRLRVTALEAWLDDPSSAPPGVRTASSAWRNELRSFVRVHQARFGV